MVSINSHIRHLNLGFNFNLSRYMEDCSEEFETLGSYADGSYGVNGTLQSADYDYFMVGILTDCL
jgi:hypothetical protein